MEPLLYVVIALLVVLIMVTLYLLLQRRQTGPSGESLTLLQNQLADSLARQDTQIAQLTEQVSRTMDALRTQTTERLDKVGTTMGNLHQQLGRLGEAATSIQAIGREVRSLQDILQSPKLRGNLGEWTLQQLLAEVLPAEHFTLQHTFANNTTVDALVNLSDHKIPIDAKFPLESFSQMLVAAEPTERQKRRRTFLRDIRKHIESIAQKYIRPDEGTLDFALMYIPAENVYYEAILSPQTDELDIAALGRQHQVVLVSPNLLYAYLRLIATGLRGLQIEKNAHRIIEQLSQLDQDLKLVEEEFQTLGKHLGNAKNKYDDTAKRLDRFGLRLRSMEKQQ